MACRNYRTLWESCKEVEIERMNGYDYVRMAGTINGVKYQTHINSPRLANRLGMYYGRIVRDTDDELLRIFSVSCACADCGEYVTKYRHMWRELVLNY